MDTFETIRERRSIKHYDPTYRISSAEESLLIDLALESPSSFNIQHWRLVDVKDPTIRAKIRAAAFDQEQVTDASLLYVICADVKAWDKDPARYWEKAPANVRNVLVPMTRSFYEGREQLQRDEAIRSTTFLAQTMMLASKAMGYDSCVLIGFDANEVAKIINLPEDHLISILLVVGKGTKAPWPKPSSIPKSEFLFRDGFSVIEATPEVAEDLGDVAIGTGFWASM
ncbi:nitroreductase family protein [Pseudomonas sp. HN11]|uniref:nitroreductase family protein n=1 Tax=Pseudomonas sp. HN11 TaxID=1344094 RepID=UPI001F48202C|nr:nitroreductase family protein [Pseudomonas sp. HN11]UII69640.1 nitroreductase family protein [Pseudomonas sp. HN11]